MSIKDFQLMVETIVDLFNNQKRLHKNRSLISNQS